MNLSSFESVFITAFLCYCMIIALSQVAEMIRIWFRGRSSTDVNKTDGSDECAATTE